MVKVHVFVTVKPGTEEAFKTASLANARASALETGIARFDVIQETDDPTKFVLVEVYKNGDAPADHKKTEHYNTWRKTVADMMAEHWLLTRGHTPDVRVVPIVIGACGSIPADWFSRLADLEATEANGAALAKKLSAAIIEQSAAMFYKWIGDARAHGF